MKCVQNAILFRQATWKEFGRSCRHEKHLETHTLLEPCLEVSIIVDGKLHIKNRSTGRTQSLEVNFHKHWDTLQKTTRDKGHKWGKLWNRNGKPWDTWAIGTPQRGERERSKSLGKSRALGGQNVPVIPQWYLWVTCVHTVYLWSWNRNRHRVQCRLRNLGRGGVCSVHTAQRTGAGSAAGTAWAPWRHLSHLKPLKPCLSLIGSNRYSMV